LTLVLLLLLLEQMLSWQWACGATAAAAALVALAAAALPASVCCQSNSRFTRSSLRPSYGSFLSQHCSVNHACNQPASTQQIQIMPVNTN
jgi:hypothetical protein